MAFELMQATGGLHLVGWLTRRIPRIFMYHRFAADREEDKISRGAFERHLRGLTASYRVVTLRELCSSAVRGGRFAERCAVITVDDGYRDFYDHAFPLLERFGVPASLFVTTDFIDGKKWLWPDELRYLITNTRHKSLEWDDEDLVVRGELHTDAGRRATWAALNELCMGMQDRRMRAFIHGLSEHLEVQLPSRPTSEFAPLSWEQLKELDRAGIEIGGHSLTHPSLTRVEPPQLGAEIEGSARRIKEMLGEYPATFCYPIGRRSDIDPKVKEAVRAAGFLGAVAAYSDGRIGEDLFELRRYPASESMYEFQKALSGVRWLNERFGSARAREFVWL